MAIVVEALPQFVITQLTDAPRPKIRIELPEIGKVVLGPDYRSRSIIEVNSINVEKNLRGEGYGSLLMSTAIDYARTHTEHDQISTVAQNERTARAFGKHFLDRELEFTEIESPSYVGKLDETSLGGVIRFLKAERRWQHPNDPYGNGILGSSVRITAPLHR